MEPNVSESTGELTEGRVVENLAYSRLQQPLIFRQPELQEVGQIFEFEDGEEDLDLLDDGEDEYYEDEICKLVQSRKPTPTDSGLMEKDSSDSKNGGMLTHYFNFSPNVEINFEEIEQRMANLNAGGTVKKEIIRRGNGVKIPRTSRVYYHYMAIVEGLPNVCDVSVTRKYPKFTDLNNTSHLVEGFELALRSMKLKEVARFVVYPTMAYGELGCPPHIPANVKIIYVVETLHYVAEEKLNSPLYMSIEERGEVPFQSVYEVAHTIRSEGNSWYKKGDYQLAIKKWRKGIQILEEYPPTKTTPMECNIKSRLLLTMYSNTGQAYLKLEKPAQACNACELGLQLAQGEDSIKLLYRFSRAKLMLKDCDGALQLVEEGLRISSKDPDLRQLEKEIFLEDEYQRGGIRYSFRRSSCQTGVRMSPQQGSSGGAKGNESKMKGDKEEKLSLKGSPARALKSLFSKKRFGKNATL